MHVGVLISVQVRHSIRKLTHRRQGINKKASEVKADPTTLGEGVTHCEPSGDSADTLTMKEAGPLRRGSKGV